MGNSKFKLTNMIPNSWLHKLKDINKPSKPLNQPPLPPLAPPSSPPTTTLQTPPGPNPQCPSRKSYHITRDLNNELPKELDSKSKSTTKSKTSCEKSSFKETNVVKTLHNNVVLLAEDDLLKIKAEPAANNNNKQKLLQVNDDILLAEDVLLKIKAETVVNNKQNILRSQHALTRSESEHVNINIKLKPIITKEKQKPKKLTIVSPRGVRLKPNSPRIIGSKQGQNGNKNRGTKVTSSKKSKSISQSFAIVKSSFDPQRDFKESMVEMILQNNLTAVRDLEDLLASYLSLNSDEYHEIIIKVFKQIWIDLRHPK